MQTAMAVSDQRDSTSDQASRCEHLAGGDLDFALDTHDARVESRDACLNVRQGHYFRTGECIACGRRPSEPLPLLRSQCGRIIQLDECRGSYTLEQTVTVIQHLNRSEMVLQYKHGAREVLNRFTFSPLFLQHPSAARTWNHRWGTIQQTW